MNLKVFAAHYDGRIIVESTGLDYVQNTPISIGDSIIYKCASNFELYFSGTEKKADLFGCARQCFLPISGKSHDWKTEDATLDPLTCECRPKPHSVEKRLKYGKPIFDSKPIRLSPLKSTSRTLGL